MYEKLKKHTSLKDNKYFIEPNILNTKRKSEGKAQNLTVQTYKKGIY